MSNPIDEYFKKNLAEVEVKPRKDLFAEKIAPRIEQRKAAFFFSPWLRVAAAVVVLLAAWQIAQLVNTPVQNQITIPTEKPIAVQQPENTLMPKATQQEAIVTSKPNKKHPAPKSNGTLVSHTPAGNAAKGLETEKTLETQANTDLVSAETKATYKVKLRIDPAKYATQTQEEQVVATTVEETPTLTEYAAAQFANIKEGDKMQSPPKEWFDLPKLAVRVDGNPFKKMLPNKE